ncbi:Methionine aminopeptidase 1 [Tilletia horrida]|nr:Methionine aminopeptidase 1 [Tilletia horrida]
MTEQSQQQAPFDPFPSFQYSGSIRPAYPLSPKPDIPPTIRRPNYAREEAVRLPWFTSIDLAPWIASAALWWEFMSSRTIRVNPPADQEGVRKAAILAREVLMEILAAAKPGVTTDELDKICFQGAIKRDTYPSPLGYHGYPKSVCTSVNEIICHGIPDRRPLEDGDVLNVGTNATIPIGPKCENDEAKMRLIRTARDCLDAAIAICGPGVPFAEIGKVIQPLAESRGCSVVKNYTGHGIGRVFHGAPTIFHHKTKKSYGVMQPGHIFTIEPMINLGPSWKDLSWPDDWTVATTDGAPSAAAEETLLITDTGVEILTAEGGPKVLDTREARKARGLLV